MISRSIGLFGGTFDPIHLGHLQMATELKAHLQLDEMYLLPCHQPPHRQTPGVSSADRLAMVELALADWPQLGLDDRECRRDKPSYSIDSVVELRAELSAELQGEQADQQVALCLCMGMDSLYQLNRWHRWRELLDYVHIVVVARPGWQLPAEDSGLDPELLEWLAAHQMEAAEALKAPCGGVVVAALSLLPISATGIRARLAAEAAGSQGLASQVLGQNPVRSLVSPAVYRYILDKQLYQ